MAGRGLLPFLPADAEALLFSRVSELAAPGSSLVVEHFGPAFAELQRDPALARFGAPFGIDMPTLVDATEPRAHPADQLVAGGWEVRSESGVALAEAYGRPLPPMSSGTRFDSEFVVARR